MRLKMSLPPTMIHSDSRPPKTIESLLHRRIRYPPGRSLPRPSEVCPSFPTSFVHRERPNLSAHPSSCRNRFGNVRRRPDGCKTDGNKTNRNDGSKTNVCKTDTYRKTNDKTNLQRLHYSLHQQSRYLSIGSHALSGCWSRDADPVEAGGRRRGRGPLTASSHITGTTGLVSYSSVQIEKLTLHPFSAEHTHLSRDIMCYVLAAAGDGDGDNDGKGLITRRYATEYGGQSNSYASVYALFAYVQVVTN